MFTSQLENSPLDSFSSFSYLVGTFYSPSGIINNLFSCLNFPTQIGISWTKSCLCLPVSPMRQSILYVIYTKHICVLNKENDIRLNFNHLYLLTNNDRALPSQETRNSASLPIFTTHQLSTLNKSINLSEILFSILWKGITMCSSSHGYWDNHMRKMHTKLL